MLTITVNGRKEKLHIGCRTFISIEDLLQVLQTSGSVVSLNGTPVARQDFHKTNIRTGDRVALGRPD